MATISIARIPQQLTSSAAIRQFLQALGFAWIAIAFGSLLYGVETYLVQPQSRFIENPPAVMMRACGLAHFWIGWLFLFSSPKLRTRSSLIRLLVLTLLGTLLCLVCNAAGSLRNPIIFIFFYSYFLVHDLRDQTDLYLASREGQGAVRGFIYPLQLAMVILVISLLTLSYFGYLYLKKPSSLGPFGPAVTLPVIALLAMIAIYFPCQKIHRVVKHQYGSWMEAFSAHLPIVAVYMLILGVLVVGTPLGGLSLNLIILIHAGIWLVHVHGKLKEKNASCKWNLWSWIRTNPRGFLFLHLAAILFILGMMALRVHLWERGGFISELFEGSNFPYWSLMHISMAFWRGR